MTLDRHSEAAETIEVPPEVGELMSALGRVDRFNTAIRVAGYRASYSAGSGWKFERDTNAAF